MTPSRRNFLGAALRPAPDDKIRLDYRKLGKTGLKVTTVGFGCMITSDGSVIERAADMGINYFDTARVYQSGNCERMVGAALKTRRKKRNLIYEDTRPEQTRSARAPRNQPPGTSDRLRRHLVPARQGEPG
jgi:diketogulonate reductase-like aldo/keto reductase